MVNLKRRRRIRRRRKMLGGVERGA